MKRHKYIVRWRFNRKFKVQRTFRSVSAAATYVRDVQTLWRVKPTTQVVECAA